MAESFLQKARQAASELGDFGCDDLALALNVKVDKAEMKSVRKVVKYLVRRRNVIILRRGFYRYNVKQKPLTKMAKMWRAMRIKEYFTRRDIQRLSGASTTHVRKYFTYLEKTGFIYCVSDNGYKADAFCLAEPEKAPLQHPTPPDLKKGKSSCLKN